MGIERRCSQDSSGTSRCRRRGKDAQGQETKETSSTHNSRDESHRDTLGRRCDRKARLADRQGRRILSSSLQVGAVASPNGLFRGNRTTPRKCPESPTRSREWPRPRTTTANVYHDSNTRCTSHQQQILSRNVWSAEGNCGCRQVAWIQPSSTA